MPHFYQEMLKHCQKTCNIQDDLYLQQAVVSVRQIVSTINTSINKRDRERELLLLQEAFNVSPLISQDSPGRTLVRTGVLQKLCHNGLKCTFMSYIPLCFHPFFWFEISHVYKNNITITVCIYNSQLTSPLIIIT